MAHDNLAHDLHDLFCEITELEDVPADKSLKDLGVDSMMALEIVTAIEKKYGIKIEESELDQVGTLDRAVRLVAVKLDTKQ